MIHPLLANAQRSDESSQFKLPMDPVTFVSEGIATAIVRHILKTYPDSFSDVNYVMTGPTDLVHDTVVAATTNQLETKYSLELAAGLDPALKVRAVEVLVEILAEGLASELLTIKDAIAQTGSVMCPYELVGSYTGVNHNTFEPEIRFRTRYGIYTPES